MKQLITAALVTLSLSQAFAADNFVCKGEEGLTVTLEARPNIQVRNGDDDAAGAYFMVIKEGRRTLFADLVRGALNDVVFNFRPIAAYDTSILMTIYLDEMEGSHLKFGKSGNQMECNYEDYQD